MNPDELETRVRPEIDPSAFVAPSADLVGDVRVGPEASVWYGCVLRGDIAPIEIGAGSNIQDLTVVHVDPGFPTRIGERVGIGHRAIVHGCTIEDDCLIGMGAILLSGVAVGRGSLIAAGAVVTEGTEVPPGGLVVGVPGRVVREVDEPLRARMERTIGHYRLLKEGHRQGRWKGPA